MSESFTPKWLKEELEKVEIKEKKLDKETLKSENMVLEKKKNKKI